jgi:ketosteroid isomerase-like protein
VKLLLIALLVLPLALLPRGSSANDSRDATNLARVVETERAFAKAGSVIGKRDAFLEYFADDIKLFPPGGAITTGKAELRAEPESVADLFWEPTWADVSAAGDMGFTTGPWQYRPDGAKGEVKAFGYFATVWVRQPDNSFKAVIDLGVGGAEPVTFKNGLDPKPSGGIASKLTPEALQQSLLDAEQEFARSASERTPDAYAAFTTDDSILHRARTAPTVGSKSIRSLLADSKVTYAWGTPAGSDVALSGDLGYTYGDGKAQFDPATNKPAEPMHYCRFWRRQGGKWKIVLEVVNPGAK